MILIIYMKHKRYPNLSTVIMVEKVLEENSFEPMKVSQLKRKLPKQVMHQSLLLILEYLWRSGKIIYGPKGIQWIYTSDMDKLKEQSVNFD